MGRNNVRYSFIEVVKFFFVCVYISIEFTEPMVLVVIISQS